MHELGYRFFDSDNHYYEPRDCFSRCIDPKHRDAAIHVTREADQRDRVWIGEKPFTFLNQDFDRAVRPGALREMLRGMGRPGFSKSQVVASLRAE